MAALYENLLHLDRWTSRSSFDVGGPMIARAGPIPPTHKMHLNLS